MAVVIRIAMISSAKSWRGGSETVGGGDAIPRKEREL